MSRQKHDRKCRDEGAHEEWQPEVTTAEGYHVPVLLHETMEQLITDPNGIYIDATFGGGGHSREILARLGERGHLFGFDQDADAERQCDIEDPRFTFVRSNFRYLAHFMNYYGLSQVTGILADLGLSSHHLDDPTRGFSFRFDAPIDMRMNNEGGRSAKNFITESSVEELTEALRQYGEIRGAYRIAQLLKEADEAGRLTTTQELIDAIAPATPPHDKKNLARIFQALRIVTNDEIGALEELLHAGSTLLQEGGRFAIITYHSLEDRPVKYFFRNGNLHGERVTDSYGKLLAPLRPLSNKPTLPSSAELTSNPRSRSAKLRIATKLPF